MAETTVLNKHKTYSDTDGWGPVPSWKNGIDTYTVRIPAGKKLGRFSFDNNSYLAGATVIQAPKPGDKGRVTFKIKWNYMAFGKVDYTIRAVAIPEGITSELTIAVGSPNWDRRAMEALEQGLRFKLVIRGAEAARLGNLLRNKKDKDVVAQFKAFSKGVPYTEKEPVTIAVTLIIVVGIIALASTAALAAVCIAAINKGMCVDATHKTNGPNPFSDELSLNVKKCK